MSHKKKDTTLNVPDAPRVTVVPDYWAIDDKTQEFFDEHDGCESDGWKTDDGHLDFSKMTFLPPYPHITDHDRNVLLPHISRIIGMKSDLRNIRLHRTKTEKELDRLIAAMLRDRRSYAKACNEQLADDPVHGHIETNMFLPIRRTRPILDCNAYTRLCRRYAVAHWSPANRADNSERNGLDYGLLWCETIPTMGDTEEDEEWQRTVGKASAVSPDASSAMDADDDGGDDATLVARGRATPEYSRIVSELSRRDLPVSDSDAPDMDAIARMCADAQEYGFSGGDLWNLDTIVSLWLYPRVRAFKKQHIGYGDEWGSDERYVRYALKPMERGFRYGALTALADVDCWCDTWCVANGFDGVTSNAMSARISQVIRHAYMLLACELPLMWI